jgi:hypothetical protein
MTALSAAASSEVAVIPPVKQQYQETIPNAHASLQQSKQQFNDECLVARLIRKDDESILEEQQLIDPRFVMPKCVLPPVREFQLVEEFVAGAVSARLSPAASNINASDPKYRQGYRAILDALRRREDPPMLRKVLLALRTAGKGSTLHQLTSSPSSTHAQLLHLIFRLDPFELPPPIKKNDLDEKEKTLAQPVLDYSLADAHFHLIIALVSANSVFLSSAVNALWKLLVSQIDDASEDR